jgi:hypothetical protein
MICKHCGKTISFDGGLWASMGEDGNYRAWCDGASSQQHEPENSPTSTGAREMSAGELWARTAIASSALLTAYEDSRNRIVAALTCISEDMKEMEQDFGFAENLDLNDCDTLDWSDMQMRALGRYQMAMKIRDRLGEM